MSWSKIETLHQEIYRRKFVSSLPSEKNYIIENILSHFNFYSRSEVEEAFDYCSSQLRVPRSSEKFFKSMATIINYNLKR